MEIHIPAITIKLPALPSALRLGGLAAVAVALALCGSRDGAQGAATNFVRSFAFTTNFGTFTSLQLNSAGHPVMSFTNVDADGIGVFRCDGPNCVPTGPGTIGHIGVFSAGPGMTASSLALDAKNLPVISYLDYANDDLRLARCLRDDCAFGGPGSTGLVDFALDSAGLVGSDSSLELDDLGRPVISYYDFTNGDLKVLHCATATCQGGTSFSSPDTGGNVGPYTSLELDAAGNPVVSYFDSSNFKLKVMHCNDPNCTGSDESIQSPDPADMVGSWTSLKLDTLGRPVISFYDSATGRLKVMHCNDVNCAGGSESIQTPDTSGFNGTSNSLVLDLVGRPVISYYDGTNGDLRVMHCNDANCAGGGESIQSPDSDGNVGQYTSIALDASGRPVVTYYDVTNGNLKLLHCGTPTCGNDLALQEIRATSLTKGWQVGPMGGACYNVDPTDTGDPTFVVCDNETGAGVDSSPRCTKDTSAACTDGDPVRGSISVAVLEGSYDLTIASAPGHVPDTHIKSCNVSAGVDSKCSFTNTPITRPWFPWDFNSDGSVSGLDIFLEIGHFNETQ